MKRFINVSRTNSKILFIFISCFLYVSGMYYTYTYFHNHSWSSHIWKYSKIDSGTFYWHQLNEVRVCYSVTPSKFSRTDAISEFLLRSGIFHSIAIMLQITCNCKSKHVSDISYFNLWTVCNYIMAFSFWYVIIISYIHKRDVIYQN